ncbi:hypothetical protein EF87_19135 [Bacillus amyloliquefaciens]|uniref:hypothetical protein n=1 Tax=Bacillus amyloliquefaciens TaxID=1390 RepID=UPI0004A11CF8|nr:hypothetical protein [Bacillus amyloliquefaciens]KDN91363.1 hypothetical protein EF87_19135 [Bacillus amyloliquefaciens]
MRLVAKELSGGQGNAPSVGGVKLTGREVSRSVPASLGGGSTGDEELQLKERAVVSGKTSGARTNPDPKD